MADQSKPSAKCYSILLFTIIAGVLLVLTVPVALNKTHAASHCNEDKTDADQNRSTIDVSHTPGNGPGYTIHNENKSNPVWSKEKIYEDKSCIYQYLIAFMLWIPVVLVCILWLFLFLLVVYSDNIKAYKQAKAREKAEKEVTPAVCCNGLRAQIWYFQCRQYKKTFMKHPMLHHLDCEDAYDNQVLSYIKSYLKNAWSIRPKTFEVDDANNYDLKVRHVFRINNEKVWNNFDGDQSSLEDIIRNLSDIHLPEVRPGSFKSQYSVPSRTRTDSDRAVAHESRSRTDSGGTVPNERASTSQNNEERGSHTEGDFNDQHGGLSAPDEGSVTQQGAAGSNPELDYEDEEDAASVQSGDSLPLLARSWRLSFSSIRTIAPSENCMFLLHGTHIENALRIVERGLDPNRAPHVGYYGKIMSLSESSWVADKFTDSLLYPRDKNLVMLIMRTSLKHAYWRLNDEHIPPSITRTYDALVSGSKKGFREFRIFKTKCCYPEFLVYYDRVRPSNQIFSI